jgi:hypothetical protein
VTKTKTKKDKNKRLKEKVKKEKFVSKNKLWLTEIYRLHVRKSGVNGCGKT